MRGKIDSHTALSMVTDDFRVCVRRASSIALPERIIEVLQLGILRDPIVCRALRGEARGRLDHGTHLTERNAKTPVALNEDLVCCLGHWSDMVTLRKGAG
jgi:hypothetical protein